MTDIAVVNRSTAASDAEIAALVPALQTWVSRDLAPWWAVDATLHFIAGGGDPPAGMWPHWVLDTSDQAGDIAYHDDSGSLPEMRTFALTSKQCGALLSVDMSHEIGECLVDPNTERMVTIGGVQYLVEACDPVEADTDGYQIDGVQVSNFVTPWYFGLTGPAPARFDMRGLLSAPCPTLRPGGYSMWLAPGDTEWQSTMKRLADGSLGHRAMRVGGRMHRRAARH